MKQVILVRGPCRDTREQMAAALLSGRNGVCISHRKFLAPHELDMLDSGRAANLGNVLRASHDCCIDEFHVILKGNSDIVVVNNPFPNLNTIKQYKRVVEDRPDINWCVVDCVVPLNKQSLPLATHHWQVFHPAQYLSL